MGKRKFILSEEEVHQLSARLGKSSCQRTRTRLLAVLMYGSGGPLAEIQVRLGCSRSSILYWCQAYRMDGFPGLRNSWRGGNNARLTTSQKADLCKRLENYTPRSLFGANTATQNGEHWTVEDLHKAIKMWYGVSYKSRTSYYSLLKSCFLGDQASNIWGAISSRV